MLANYSLWNLLNQSDYAPVFTEGTEQARRTLAPVEASVIMPGFNYNYSVFETYVVDVSSDPSDPSTSIGTAAFSVQGDVGSQWLVDSNNLLSFQWCEGYSQDLAQELERVRAWWAVMTTDSGMAVNTRMGHWTGDAFVDVAVDAVDGDGRSDVVGRTPTGQG